MIGLGSDKNRQRKTRSKEKQGEKGWRWHADQGNSLSYLNVPRPFVVRVSNDKACSHRVTKTAVTMTKAKQNQIFGHNIGGHPEIQCKGINQFSR